MTGMLYQSLNTLLKQHKVGQYHGSNSFQYHGYMTCNAKIMASFYRECFHITGIPVQCVLIFGSTSRWFNRNAIYQFIPIGNTTYNTTGMVGTRCTVCIYDSVVVF